MTEQLPDPKINRIKLTKSAPFSVLDQATARLRCRLLDHLKILGYSADEAEQWIAEHGLLAPLPPAKETL